MSRQLLLEILPTPGPSLDNTVVGANAAAIDAARGLARGRALYLWGPPGCGRSHLLRAMTQDRSAFLVEISTPAEEIMALATTSAPFSGVELVAVDDVHEMTPEQQAAVFALYNRWRELAATANAFGLVVTGDRAPMMMSLREDLRTRLGWDLVFRLDPLSDTEKLEALAAYAQRCGLPLSEEVLDWMLTHYTRDIRQLFALVDALDRYSLSKHRTVTVPLVRQMLSDREFLQS
ncbi:DnaA regulatory inactivator Hda [Zwartia sp.]|uniref:DnaA regulatory inactivator Hda n=1 Tax=Zwartia sp. TaxID=2978004 RepID=UPI002726E892|nr:DnaA regulatory inactivator Hda [Zwartia sp.]MDO9025211.1 DnaA regulatory inactivator Hda [Zwartia sp.]